MLYGKRLFLSPEQEVKKYFQWWKSKTKTEIIKKPPLETQNMVVKMKYPKRNKNKRPGPKKMNNAENLVNAVGKKKS